MQGTCARRQGAYKLGAGPSTSICMRALVDADTGARRSPGQKAAHADALDASGGAGRAGEVDAGGEPLPEEGEGPALLM